MSWWYDDGNMVEQVWRTDRQTDRRTDRRTDGQTDWTSHIAAWSQLKYLYIMQSYDMWMKSRSHQYLIGRQDSAHIGVIQSWCPIYWTQINNHRQSLIYKGWLSESFRSLFYRTQTLKVSGVDNFHRQFVLVTLTLSDLVLSDRHNGCHLGLTGCHRKKHASDFIPNL